MKGIQDLPLAGKKVLIRVDFNVPCTDGKITDDSRIQSTLPTIRYALEQGALPILLSHRGRPKGKVDAQYSLAPCRQRLEELLQMPVQFASSCVGEETTQQAASLKAGEILLLENLRFYEAEEKPDQDPSFAEHLASLGDCYVNDAFATCHRPHSSIVPITLYFPGQCAAGFLLQKEIEFLGGIFKHPHRPLMALIGGAKVSTKMKAIEALLPHIDSLLIGGGMAYTFLKSQGQEIGGSICEKECLETAAHIIEVCQEKGIHLLLPVDSAIVSSLEDKEVAYASEIHQDIGVDIGPKTVDLYRDHLKGAGTIFWNGPMGIFENPLFAQGTNALAEVLAHSQATTVVGGGETVDAIHRLGLEESFTHLSTGGGASIEFIEQGTLPGIEALEDEG